MKHKVTCSDCGRAERITIEGTKILSDWVYFGKIDINVCKTTKYWYSLKDAKNLDDAKRVPNKCYDPTVKRKYVEIWECASCNKGDRPIHEQSI